MGKRRGMTHHKPPRGISKGNKMHKVMSEWKHGTLHMGSKHGKKVVNYRQAVAIGLSEQRRANR